MGEQEEQAGGSPEGGQGSWSDALGAEAGNPPEPRAGGETILVYRNCSGCKGTGKDPEGLLEKCPDCGGTGKGHDVAEQWTVSKCELRIKAQFEQRVRSEALAAALAVGDSHGPEAGAMAVSAYIADRAAGYYNWEGRYIRRTLDDVFGIRTMLYLLLRRCHPQITEDRAFRLFKEAPGACTFALRWALGNSEPPPAAGGNGRKVTDEQRADEQGRERQGTATGTRKKTPATLDP